ncbi:hypothetical protein LAZ67_12001291 [Cordylochernes scorpioides]|uniref:Integrase catalytic domain-containing protein n=1 Tax=Cordylochernes scorpioides TaxID=51811 RepID=A0ABY6L1K9_9ARAC|nr:hypothetical protein LAZ67_12001291 [Cordylochernes scorpioides]
MKQRRNVMSLQSTLDKGFEMKMDEKGCKLFKTTTGEVIVEGKRLPGGLYEGLEPKTYKEAMDSPNAQFWKEAMNEEMNSLTENDVYECTTLPPGEKPIDCKWVLKTKLNSKGEITIYKARLVAKGFAQKKGIDCGETFSPVARYDTIRTLLAIAANEDLKLVQFDIKAAFLYGDLQDQIYIKQPEGFNNGTDLVWKLKKSLYGLKQITNDQLLIIAIYVDDGIIAGTNEQEIKEFLDELMFSFKITSEPFNYFLGIEIERQPEKLRTDNGTEFINQNLETFIESKGIKHELTTPYTPRSNGRVERANRTLLDKGRTLLADSQLPLHFWAEAVNTAAYLYNLTPTTNDPDTTPMEKWKGKKPSVSHIMRFGCEVFYKLENHQRHKLEAKSKRGIFVGYSRCRRAYRVFDITARVILETAEIHFRENNNVISEEKQSDNNTDTDTYFFIQEDEQLDNYVLSDVDIEEPAPDTMINRQTESSGSDRPQRTRTIPKRFDDYVLATTNETIPKDYDEAIACEDKKHWENAMLEEIQNMYSHQVWELVPRPVNAKVVRSKWVFKISKDQENKTYKARLVAMGYNQIPGRDYNESFSPVIKNATLRTVLSMAATKDSVIKLFDVKAAYLNGNIENTIFMEQHAGFVQDRNKVCKLNKSIYGLPQSVRSWYEKFSQVLHDCGLEKLKSDLCLFKWRNEDKYFYVGIYVDDFITVSDSEDTSNRFINKLRHHLEIKDVTCKGMFLGIKIIQDKEGISLQQSHYVQQILQKYGMETCKEVPTPGSKEINLDNHIEDNNCDQHTYQEALGMLMFLAVNTRPDIAYITSKLSQYSRQPKQMHWTAIKRVMRYLRGTIDLGVKFERGKTGILKSYTDASWSTTHVGKSYGGYVLKLGEATIDWKSSKQPLVALSTMEAETIAACESCCQIKWIINLLRELEEWNFMEKTNCDLYRHSVIDQLDLQP